jgi:leucyl aminopeptidase
LFGSLLASLIWKLNLNRWFKAGYNAAFTFESPFNDHSPYIHTANDEVVHIDFEHVSEFVKLALGYVIELTAEF